MANSALELQRSLYLLLKGDATLTAALGGPRVYDDVPQRAELPYVTFGQSLVRDWSTGSEPGHEHLVTLHVWSRAPGRKKVHEIIDVLVALLHDRKPELEFHQIVNLRHELSEARRDSDGETYHGIVRYRVVTEPV
ncbi:MAG: DUF3168 domain-containing protein [Hyphomicrobiaceae bacterium]|nr:DUF3168 domain-containing protein [Hyphomicrobiaceae bacterium]